MKNFILLIGTFLILSPVGNAQVCDHKVCVQAYTDCQKACKKDLHCWGACRQGYITCFGGVKIQPKEK